MAGIEEFWDVLKDYRKLSVWAAGGSVVIPFVAQFIGVVPPYPSGLNVITAVLQLLTLMAIFQVYRGRSKKIVTRRMLQFMLVCLLAILCYFFAYSILVITGPDDRVWSIGTSCTEKALLLFADKCPLLSYDELKSVGFIEETLWTIPSIATVRLILISLWFGFFGFLAGAMGIFLVYQRK